MDYAERRKQQFIFVLIGFITDYKVVINTYFLQTTNIIRSSRTTPFNPAQSHAFSCETLPPCMRWQKEVWFLPNALRKYGFVFASRAQIDIRPNWWSALLHVPNARVGF